VGHDAQLVAPGVAWKLPAAQLAHATEPVAGWDVPDAQLEQELDPADACTVPATQLRHVVAADAANLPAKHWPVTADKPAVPQKLPAGHELHADWPDSGW